ncbi:hypothetical protein [Catellatospora methionotrophica]|uniref:hypothetical protein n=1 Tax=Catellatospora methionotrophica TaxID=121620 RepID=UPI0033D8E595
MRATLEAIAWVDEQWLAPLVTADWTRRYGGPVHGEHLARRGVDADEYVMQVGADGMHLLRQVYRQDTPAVISRLAQVEVLRQVWVQQFYHDHDGRLCWRQAKTSRARKTRSGTARRATAKADDEMQSAMVPWSSVKIVTPHDPDARFSHKPGKIEWIGYKDHQTETCDDGYPDVIVQVLTTSGLPPDKVGGAMVPPALSGRHASLTAACGGVWTTSAMATPSECATSSTAGQWRYWNAPTSLRDRGRARRRLAGGPIRRRGGAGLESAVRAAPAGAVPQRHEDGHLVRCPPGRRVTATWAGRSGWSPRACGTRR